MKKLLLLIMTMITSLVYSQNQLLGFETAETGGLDGGPFGSGIYTVETGTGTNTTKVLKVEGNTGGDVWQGINLNLSTNVQLTTSKTMTIDVFSNSPITFLVKCTGGVSGAPAAAAAVTHNGNGTWQTLSFTFNSVLDGQAATANGIYSKFVIHTYWATGATAFAAVTKDSRVFYVDNIKGIASSVVDPVPSSSANNPTHPNSDVVLSLFSDKPGFTNNYTPEGEFGSRTLINLDAENDQTIKMNFASDGWGQYNNTTVNISTANYLHFNYYAPNLAAGVNGHEFYIMLNSGSGEKLYTITAANMVFDTWQTISIPMSHFTALGFNKATLQTWKLGTPSNLNTKLVYFDNIYFTQNALGFAATSLPLIQDFDTASSLTTPAAFEGLASSTIVSDPVSGGTRGNVLKMQLSSTGQPWQGSDFSQLVKKAKLTTNKTMKIDVYATQAFNLLVKVETGGPASATAQAYTTPNQWQTLTFDFNTTYDGTAAANGEYSKLIFFGNWKSTNDGFISPPGSFAFHIDNIRAEAAAIAPPLPLIQDFDTASSLTTPAAFEGLASSTIVSDPVSGGTRGNVLKMQLSSTGQPWQGSDFSQLVKKAKLTTNKTMKIDVYATQAFNLLVKVETGGPASATAQAYTTPNQWQTLTFDFNTTYDGTAAANGEYSKLIFFGNWKSTNDGFISPPGSFAFHIDNIRAEAAAIVAITPAPTVAAPTPPSRLPSNVVSIFSGAYTNISPINYDAGWCGASSIEKTTAGGDSIIAYKDKPCQGIDFSSAVQNLTGFTHIHIDLFIAAGTSLVGKVFNLKVAPTSGAESEFPIDINALSPAPVPGTWYSYDVPVSFSGPVSSIKQFGITSDNLNNKVWYDNLYFYKNTPTTGLTQAPTPTRAASNVISVFSDAYTSPSAVNTNPNWGQSTQSTQFQISGNNTILFKNLNYQGIVFNDTNYRMNLTAAGMTHLHIDYQTKQTGTFKMFLISPGPKEASYNLTIPTTGWNSLDIPLTSFPAPVDLSQVFQIKFDNGGGTNFSDSILIDNIYFYKSTATTSPVPLTPAPTPTRAASNVKSIYSDAYTNVSVNEWGPAWGPEASTITDFPISGNATKVINMTSGKVFAGIDFAPSKFNATEYTHFHFDYWTPTPLNAGQVLNIKLSNHDGSGESNALEHTSTSLQTGQWVSLDIPLANFTPVTNANKGNIAQIVLSAARASLTDPFTIYFDNVYFYKSDGNPTPVADSIKFPLTFEQTSLNYNFLSVGNATTKIVSNPNIDASNSSPLVAKTTKASGSIPLSGASIQFPTNIDLTNATSIKIQVWSPLAFIKVKVRLQSSSNPNKFIDIDQILNTPNSWQELDFVLPRLTGSAATEYQKFAVFFDADNPGTGSDFYFDNVRLLKSTSGIAHVSSSNMTIYPNPAKNFIRLESLVPFDMVEIYSIHGKRVLTKAIKGLDLEIDIKHLSQGQYILRTYGDGKMTNFHFIKD